MKVIDNPKTQGKSSSAKPLDDLVSTLRFGKTWSTDMHAQASVIALLDKSLDNRYIMLRNVQLEGLDIPIPLVLVGPTGVRVLYPSASRGVYRAKGEIWEQMDDRSRMYRAAAPNLLTRTELMARAVAAFLTSREVPLPEIEPILMFSDPGTHVESVRPSVRIVLVDGLERFIGGMLQSRSYLDKIEVQKIVDLLTRLSGIDPDASPYPERDAFSFSDEDKPSRLSTLTDSLPRGEGVVSSLNKIPFSNRQWGLLGCMAVFNILLLVAFVILILLTS
jgi:hypothetical protein